jgi:hypothetical protein
VAHHRLNHVLVPVALCAIAACGDEKGVQSLEGFYAQGADRGSSGGPGQEVPGEADGSGDTGVTCSISTNALVAYLPFDDDGRVRGSASFRTTNASSLSFLPGRRGSALRGSDQIFMEATTAISMSSWTACAWVRVASSSNMGFLAIAGSTPVNSGFGVAGSTAECGGSGGLVPYLSSSRLGCVAPSSPSLPSDTFTFVCMVSSSENGQTQIIVDGSTRATRAGALPLSLSSGTAIAVGGGPEETPSGTPNAIDDFSLWGRALSSSELATLAASPCIATGAAENSEESP